jgi:gamma-glutamylcyclotransferase (GGCT)/AIG2-like uncharacterized protein YtfP
MTTGEPRESIFVYGTLRRGASNHHRLKGAVWRGAATVRGVLYQVSWYPGLVLRDDQVGRVRGDCFEVPVGLMGELDAFEGLPPGSLCGEEYERVRIDIDLVDGESIRAWAWLWRAGTDGLSKVGSGDWLEVEKSGTMGK